MEKPTVLKTLTWLRRKFPEKERDVTLYNLFVRAFVEHFHVLDDHSQLRIQCDIEAFEAHGNLPQYLSRFMRRLCAQYFVPQQQTEGDRSCMSAK